MLMYPPCCRTIQFYGGTAQWQCMRVSSSPQLFKFTYTDLLQPRRVPPSLYPAGLTVRVYSDAVVREEEGGASSGHWLSLRHRRGRPRVAHSVFTVVSTVVSMHVRHCTSMASAINAARRQPCILSCHFSSSCTSSREYVSRYSLTHSFTHAQASRPTKVGLGCGGVLQLSLRGCHTVAASSSPTSAHGHCTTACNCAVHSSVLPTHIVCCSIGAQHVHRGIESVVNSDTAPRVTNTGSSTHHGRRRAAHVHASSTPDRQSVLLVATST